jgi:hypothetical protein
VPPFEPGPPSRGARPGPYGPGPGSGTARPPAGPGHGPSAGRRPVRPGAPGEPGWTRPGGTFDGGYAQVIRSTDHPARPDSRNQPNPGRPADPARPARPAGPAPRADRDVYVYRDVSDPAPKPPARHAAPDDTAYWYDLLAEDPAPQPEAARGPFEPLRSSTGTPSTAGQQPGADQARRPPDAARDERLEPAEQARARKLEQLKDLYLTAEAIGEQNVDKHFDLLLAQQRELISDYFRQSAAAQPGGSGQAAETEPQHRQASGQATPPEGVSVRAEPPHAW